MNAWNHAGLVVLKTSRASKVVSALNALTLMVMKDGGRENPFDYASSLTTVLDDDEWETYLDSDDCPI